MRHRVSAAVMAAALGGPGLVAAGPAQAIALVSMSADSGFESASAESGPELAGEPFVSGRAEASEDSSNANVVAGPLPNCAGPAGCSQLSHPPEAGAYAAANGNTGSLHAGASASDGSSANAHARAALTDTITLVSPIIDISFDIEALGEGNALDPGQTQGSASLLFTMGFVNPDAGPEEIQSIPLLTVEVWDNEDGGGGYAAWLREDEENPFSAGPEPDFLSFSIDLSSQDFADLFASPFPGFPQPSWSDAWTFGFSLLAAASCDTNNCFAQARADDSLYIKLQGLSASGYSYPGILQEPGPDPDPIPEPASLILLLTGLFGLKLWLSRSRVASLQDRSTRRGIWTALRSPCRPGAGAAARHWRARRPCAG